MNKVLMITSSIRCLRYGVLSLLPVVGIPFLILAFSNFHRARKESDGAWNPAQRHLVGGCILACVGAQVLLVTLGLIAYAYVQTRLD
jgi:hypothetical protein